MDALGIIILCLTGLLARPTDAQSLQVAMISTHTPGHYGDVACPPGSVIEVLDAWVVATNGQGTCTLPLSQVDPAHLSEIQGCSGTRSCSHVAVKTGQKVTCPGSSFFGDTIDTIIVEFQCVPEPVMEVTTTGTSTEMTSPLTTRQGAPQTEPPGTTSEGATHFTAAPDSQTPGLGLYIGLAVGAGAIVLLIVVTALVYRRIMRKRAKAKSEKPTDLLSVTHQGAPSNQRHRFSDYANHDHLFLDDPHGEVAHDSQPLSVVWGCPQRRVVTESESPEQVRSQNEDVAGVYMDMGAAGNVIPTYLELSP